MARRDSGENTYSTLFLITRIAARIAFYVLVILLAVFFAREAYRFGYSVFHSNPMTGAPGKDIAVTITEGMSRNEVGELLARKGLIRDSRVYAVQARIYRYKVYPGTYILNTSQSIDQMIAIMSVEPETEAESVIPGEKSGGGA